MLSVGLLLLALAAAEGAGRVAAAAAPRLTLTKTVTPPGDARPGAELSYEVVVTNDGDAPAQAVQLQDQVPDACDFKVDSIFTQMGTSGLTATVAYSNDDGTTWTYTPMSGGGGAPPGFDRRVTSVRWTLAGVLSSSAPMNQVTVGFDVRIR